MVKNIECEVLTELNDLGVKLISFAIWKVVRGA